MTNNILLVKISSPDKQIWEGEAKSVSSVNSKGAFDILPLHANFISIVEDKPITVQTKSEKKEFKFKNAIIYASKNIVQIYTEI